MIGICTILLKTNHQAVTSTIKPACYVFLFKCTIKASKEKIYNGDHVKQTAKRDFSELGTGASS